MKKIAVIHAYSSRNRGDGLLVDHALTMIREAYGDCDVTLAASDPGSFTHLDVSRVGTRPSVLGYSREYLRFLQELNRFDVVIAVGGGYLRAGYPKEAAKMLLVMGPQLLMASKKGSKVIYLPQSVGPLNLGVRPIVRRLLSRVDAVFLRDDRSVDELRLANAIRVPDMAAMTLTRPPTVKRIRDRPVLSVRSVKGELPDAITRLRAALGVYDAYVQSTVGGNDDSYATSLLQPREVLGAEELMAHDSRPRVVVAMRLHAALMALRAGHYVVHLAYERKGFGAFQDLGISEYVHHYKDFDVNLVVRQVEALIAEHDERLEYDEQVSRSLDERMQGKERIRRALLSVGAAEG